MSQRSFPQCLALLILLAGLAVLALPTRSTAADEPKPEERRVVRGKSLSPAGMLLTRQAPGKAWQALGKNDDIHSRDLVLALPGAHAALKTPDGAVELKFLGNLPQMSDFPVLESAVVLHDTAGVDLDFTLERGRVLVVNHKAKGAANVRVRVAETTVEVTLEEPESTIALDYVGRLLQGGPFNKDPKQAAEPTFELDCLVAKGSAAVKIDGHALTLRAPPGPAVTHWSNVGGSDATAQRLEKLPDWAEPGATTPADKLVGQALESLAERLKDKPIQEALTGLLQDSKKGTDPGRATILRGIALYGLGAVDDLDGLVDVLTEGDSPDARAAAIDALRHWIGRAAGNDIAFYNQLSQRKKFSPAHAEITASLLHSFSSTQLREPETRDLLLSYVKHPRLAVRELARWHLMRLVPRAKEVVYDAAGPAEEQERAYQEWKKRLPAPKPPRDK